MWEHQIGHMLKQGPEAESRMYMVPISPLSPMSAGSLLYTAQLRSSLVIILEGLGTPPICCNLRSDSKNWSPRVFTASGLILCC